MRLNNGHALDLAGLNGEMITVSVAKSKAKVDLMLHGQPFTGSQFKLDRTTNDPFFLAIGGVFTDKKNGGGAFSVSLTGSGVTATQAVTQFSPKEARRGFVFTIDVL